MTFDYFSKMLFDTRKREINKLYFIEKFYIIETETENQESSFINHFI